jgi:NAD(P)-dependent dehydrogenase (short-subunit alcohol dehydrogenase family)
MIKTPRSVVFGGTGGIGRAVGELLAARGHEVTIVGRSAQIPGFNIDASDDEAVARFFEGAEPFDHVVISLAGGSAMGPFQAISDQALRLALDVKLFAYLNVARRARVTTGGSITFVTGVSGSKAIPHTASLTLANAAIEALTRMLALEYAPVRVNAVAPGTTATQAWDRMPQAIRDEMFEATAQRTPLRRIAQPQDIALAVGALIENSFVTGVVSVCDGGLSLV